MPYAGISTGVRHVLRIEYLKRWGTYDLPG